MAHCINFYFEGKGEINKLLIPLFTHCVRQKTSNHKKFEEFLELNSKSIPETESLDSAVIWQEGVKSWHHYRRCRLQQENLKLQTVLDRLVSADLIFRGTSAPFSDHFDFDGAMFSAFQEAITCKSWIKIFNDQHWLSFINELKKDSPKILTLQTPPTTNKANKEDLVGILFD